VHGRDDAHRGADRTDLVDVSEIVLGLGRRDRLGVERESLALVDQAGDLAAGDAAPGMISGIVEREAVALRGVLLRREVQVHRIDERSVEVEYEAFVSLQLLETRRRATLR